MTTIQFYGRVGNTLGEAFFHMLRISIDYLSCIKRSVLGYNLPSNEKSKTNCQNTPQHSMDHPPLSINSEQHKIPGAALCRLNVFLHIFPFGKDNHSMNRSPILCSQN